MIKSSEVKYVLGIDTKVESSLSRLFCDVVASHATICATTSLISQQRLIVGKQHLIDKKNVVNPIFDEILNYKVKLLTI